MKKTILSVLAASVVIFIVLHRPNSNLPIAPSAAAIDHLAQLSFRSNFGGRQSDVFCSYDSGQFRPGYSFVCVSGDRIQGIKFQARLTVLNIRKKDRVYFLVTSKHANTRYYEAEEPKIEIFWL